MLNVDIPIRPNVDCQAVERIIDDVIVQENCQVSLRGTLKKFPGCIHWHIKRLKASGTLEVTLWPQQNRAWFTIQDGRRAPWIEETMNRLATLMQQRLDGERADRSKAR